ncbi:hypothetical protein IAT38_004171 [Cryptococcus sp. DSM 104549]
MNTGGESITKAMRKLHTGNTPSLSSHSPARARFTDFPIEVIEKNLDHVDKCHPLVLLCKQTHIPAGEKLYSKGPAITTEFPSRMRPMGFEPLDPFLPTQATLPQLLCGMDIKEPSPLSPFGRDLKMRFMRQLPRIHHYMLSDKEFDYLSGLSLLAEGLEPFPALLDLRLVFHPNRLGDQHPYSRNPINPFVVRRMSIVMNLAALCKPERPSGLIGACGHVPQEAHHYVCDEEEWRGVDWTKYERPLPPVLHGTHNVVLHLREPGADTKSEAELKRGCTYHFSCLEKVMKEGYTKCQDAYEEDSDGEDAEKEVLSQAEQELRAKTRWSVKWSSTGLRTEAHEDVKTEVRARVEDQKGLTLSDNSYGENNKDSREIGCLSVLARRWF